MTCAVEAKEAKVDAAGLCILCLSGADPSLAKQTLSFFLFLSFFSFSFLCGLVWSALLCSAICLSGGAKLSFLPITVCGALPQRSL